MRVRSGLGTGALVGMLMLLSLVGTSGAENVAMPSTEVLRETSSGYQVELAAIEYNTVVIDQGQPGISAVQTDSPGRGELLERKSAPALQNMDSTQSGAREAAGRTAAGWENSCRRPPA